MKSAFIEAVKAFANQAKANYAEHVKKEYNRLYPVKPISNNNK